MNKIVTSLCVISLLCGISHAQKRNAQKKTEQPIYATEPIDIDTQKLPPNYIGHNIVALYLALEKYAPPKNEFETSQHHLERLSALTDGKLKAFKIAPEGVRTEYDADNAVMKVQISSQTVPGLKIDSDYAFKQFEHSLSLVATYSISSFKISTISKASSYTASNSFGVKARVNKITQIAWCVADKRAYDFASLRLDFPMSSVDARRIKPRIAVLLVGKLAVLPLFPLLHFSYDESNSPTISDHFGYYARYFNVAFDLQGFWIYDLETGNILLKADPNSLNHTLPIKPIRVASELNESLCKQIYIEIIEAKDKAFRATMERFSDSLSDAFRDEQAKQERKYLDEIIKKYHLADDFNFLRIEDEGKTLNWATQRKP